MGPRFRSIHLQLDEVVSAAREFSDTVAERAAALGVPPDGRPETITSAFTLPGPKDGWVRDTEVVEATDKADLAGTGRLAAGPRRRRARGAAAGAGGHGHRAAGPRDPPEAAHGSH